MTNFANDHKVYQRVIGTRFQKFPFHGLPKFTNIGDFGIKIYHLANPPPAGHFKEGIPHGICWRGLFGGSWIYGRVNQEGLFSGENFFFEVWDGISLLYFVRSFLPR
jgi:hypothetical protein